MGRLRRPRPVKRLHSSGPFGFGVQTLHRSGPSQAAHPPAESGRSLLRWHRHCDHVGQPFGRLEVFVRSRSSSEWCLSLAWNTTSKVRSCFYPWERFTTERRKHDSVGKVLPTYSRTRTRSGKASTPFIPWLKPRGFLAEKR